MLEIVERGRETAAQPVPLLFVHGALHGAWCWDEHFLGYFAEHGYHALALNLRGHGASPTSVPLRSVSLADYIDDVRVAAAGLPVAPVLIGHSLGGFLVQKYLETDDASGAVLFASTPPTGGRGLALRGARRHPWLNLKSSVTGKLLPMFGTTAAAREWFFSADMPESLVTRYAGQLQEESFRASMQAVLGSAHPDRVRAPMLVLGAANDNMFSVKETRATARAYRTEAIFVPNIAHSMMLEAGWQNAADHILNWLGGLQL
ncbi:alpha/beta hydrolase [Nocardia sp. NPDC051570]|uniref:alpha/beta hydrolase n=1 Tax=Nocardia sp. NPDC051570 TaxID=3364324 RepID=UPI003791DEC8